MKQINKNNYKNFLEYYNDFHDGYIQNINYDTETSKITVQFEVWSQGMPVLKNNNSYEEKK